LATVLVSVLVLFVLPIGAMPAETDTLRLLNIALVVVYLAVTTPLALLWGGLSFRMCHDDPVRERRLVLQGPLRLVTVQLVFWMGAVLLFGALNFTYSWRLGLAVAETVMIGGVTSCAVSYLLAERILRPAAARVLAGEPPPRRPVKNVLLRWVLFWTLGTAVPVTGLLSYGIGALVLQDVPARQLAAVLVIGALGVLATGLVTTVGAARSVADPITSVREAMHRVEQGELDVSVPVYDGTELGRLQAGFNTMAAGLRERERIRDLFARQVGKDVARVTAAADEVELGGEVREVGVLFVDLVGSTALAVARPPTEVVALLNRFFAVVVHVVDESGGWVNKFEGDAALAVFGAPTGHPDPAGQALEAGRLLAVRLAEELPDISTGIGVSAGEAVAGYVGDVHRFEYTVIGDPVNEAARLVELAKDVPGGLLASGIALELAGPEESARWQHRDAVVLRGRSDATTLATPLADAPASADELRERRELPELDEPVGPAGKPVGP
jgi:adenylate cyclase